MKFFDFLSVVFVWCAAGGIISITKTAEGVDWIFAIICVAAAYYLSKWIIFKRDPEIEETE